MNCVPSKIKYAQSCPSVGIQGGHCALAVLCLPASLLLWARGTAGGGADLARGRRKELEGCLVLPLKTAFVSPRNALGMTWSAASSSEARSFAVILNPPLGVGWSQRVLLSCLQGSLVLSSA